jgi:hypothetical protein
MHNPHPPLLILYLPAMVVVVVVVYPFTLVRRVALETSLRPALSTHERSMAITPFELFVPYYSQSLANCIVQHHTESCVTAGL